MIGEDRRAALNVRCTDATCRSSKPSRHQTIVKDDGNHGECLQEPLSHKTLATHHAGAMREGPERSRAEGSQSSPVCARGRTEINKAVCQHGAPTLQMFCCLLWPLDASCHYPTFRVNDLQWTLCAGLKYSSGTLGNKLKHH